MRHVFFALLLSVATAAVAQPASQRGAGALPPADALALPGLDNAAQVRLAETARRSGAAPLRFAEPVAVSVDPVMRGGWSTHPDGTRIWRMAISSPGAYSLSFGFTRFQLPAGASLWIYAEGEAPEYRPFTAEDNEVHGELWTPIVPGDRAVVELNLPPAKGNAEVDFELVLGQVNHAFRPTLLSTAEKQALGVGASGSCNVDVACPEGDDYRDIIRSVGAFTLGGVDYCSGAAINNTSGDGRPLFLTADHCEVRPANAAQVVVYWNYQNSTCRVPGSAASGAPGDGSRAEFNSGTVARGNGATSDWSILELDDPILPSARVFLAGWDRRDLAPTSGVAIHHPAVEEKRISFENDGLTITVYNSGTTDAAGTHLRVADWDLGTTEGGSSGSPLFNADRRIVGQLHGGSAACGNDQPDWYGRLFRSMNDGLAAILDPGGTGAPFIDGKDNEAAAYAAATVSADRVAPGETVRFTFTVANPTASAIAVAQFVNPLPTGLTFAGNLSASAGTASEADGIVEWAGALASGAELTIAYDATVDGDAAGGEVVNQATTTIGAGLADLVAAARLTVVTTRPAPDHVYEATPALAIRDDGCPTFDAATLTVPDAFTVGRVSVGAGIVHTWRGDLRVRLTSPAGTTVDLLNRVGSGANGSSAENLDVLIDDAGTVGAFASADHDADAPYYDTEGAPEAGEQGAGGVGALAAFAGESAQGTWTLGVCDGAGLDTGTLQRWSLQFVEAEATSTDDGLASAPFAVTLAGPNPVSFMTRAELAVDRPQHVRASLVDATGREVLLLFADHVADAVSVKISVAEVAAGAYFLRVEGEGASRTLPMTVVR